MAGDTEEETMVRGMYGPDVTFLGVPRADLDDPAPGRRSTS